MDAQSKDRLDEILRKEFAALTPGDKDFLRARESYLTPDQKAAYAGVFPDEDAPKPLAEQTDKELAKLAKSLSLNPKDFDDRDALIAGIEAAQAAQQ